MRHNRGKRSGPDCQRCGLTASFVANIARGFRPDRVAWRQRQEGDIVGTIQIGCGVPSGLIRNDEGMGTGFDL